MTYQIQFSACRIFAVFIFCFSSMLAISAQANHVYVSELFSGSVIGVDSSGNKQTLTAGFGRPGPIAFDKQGTLYVYDYDQSGVYRVSAKGSVSWYAPGPPSSLALSRSVVDITVTDSGEVLLLNHAFPEEGAYSEIWLVRPGHSPKLRASTLGYAAVGQTARGFTVGPKSRLYLAMQGGDHGQGATARVLAVDSKGRISTYYDSGLINLGEGGTNFIDVRFGPRGEMYLLVTRPLIPAGEPNPREIWKVVGGVSSILVPSTLLRGNALQMDIDTHGHLFVSGGGFGGGSQLADTTGFLFDVAPSGDVTLRAEFPPFGTNKSNPIVDVAVAPDRGRSRNSKSNGKDHKNGSHENRADD